MVVDVVVSAERLVGVFVILEMDDLEGLVSETEGVLAGVRLQHCVHIFLGVRNEVDFVRTVLALVVLEHLVVLFGGLLEVLDALERLHVLPLVVRQTRLQNAHFPQQTLRCLRFEVVEVVVPVFHHSARESPC